ncbi:MAG: hypothetical protein PHP06_01395 [Clostridia bacterium]|nr:hypothetical protein [Clostridia bacterium]
MNFARPNGSALVLVVIVMMLLSILCMALLNLSLLNYNSVLNQDFMFYAYYIAESGAGMAKHDLNRELLDILPYKFNYNDFQDYKSKQVKAVVEASYNKDKQLLILESTGFVGEIKKKVEVGFQVSHKENGDIDLVQKYFKEKKLNTDY